MEAGRVASRLIDRPPPGRILKQPEGPVDLYTPGELQRRASEEEESSSVSRYAWLALVLGAAIQGPALAAPPPPAVSVTVAPESVNLARSYLGQSSKQVKGKLSNFTAAGGTTNNCADFVSAILEQTDGLQGHYINVRALESALGKQGWKPVSAAKAQPGDVWVAHDRAHIELVTEAGGQSTIGSSNDRPGHQKIIERSNWPKSGVYYTRG